MTRRALILILPLSILATGAAAEVRSFGKPLAGLAPASLAEILAKPQAGQRVRLEGTVAAVCRSRGCWLELKQADKSVHVTFEGYSFFVPKDSAGKAVVLEGVVKLSEPDAERAEHLQKEGAGEAAAARVSIEATGVEIR